MPSADAADPHFNHKLRDVLAKLNNDPYPYLPSPPNLNKRASVALVIRVRPDYGHWPPVSRDSVSFPLAENEDPRSRIESFFAQDWVKHGTPEILFIKRASRGGDRWSGHIALPGGKRDPEDEDDAAAAVRETMEEVGIDLLDETVVHAGSNLPQRIVTSSWGKIPLMVLCPYIYLLTRHGLPPLHLQPAEIASVHWVPLKSLLSPSMRTFEYQDVSARFARQEFGLKRLFYKSMLGHMLFCAVRLVPSESLMSEPPAPTELAQIRSGIFSRAMISLRPERTTQPSLQLWGLTLGVLADFLELLPPHNALELWTYPTFSAPDVQFLVWALGFRFRTEKFTTRSKPSNSTAPAEVEVGLDSIPKPAEDTYHEQNPPGAGEGGLGVHLEHEKGVRRRRVRRGSSSSRIGFMLDGYYEIIRRAIVMAMVGRGTATIGAILWLWRRFRRR